MVNRYFRYSYKLMPFPIHDKLVIAVASSALFDLRESDAVYREKGTEVYRKYLDISRGAFLSGGSPHCYINAFCASLFLSANQADVEEAIQNGYPAGRVLGDALVDDPQDTELRVAFDFDGVLADDEAECVYQEKKL